MNQPFDGDQLEALFQQATSLDDAARRHLLEQVTAANPLLGEELTSLVEADARAQDFLRPEPSLRRDPTKPGEGRDIGPYRLLSKIGQGGNSEVYLAIRLEGPFRRRVAVKIMTLTAGAEQLRRFRAEQQILAGLEHPNIARLYDGGTTEMGLPFFVMEYIEGEPIDVYCRRHQLPVQERVELVHQVCRGVQHAHQNLVVHRDLKPANILVTTEGVPKLLDFGIAKSLNPEITNLGTHPTTPWDRMLTPQYASPEQISGLATTTPSDVYSLGVILFELLTDRLPYCFEDGMTAADMERQLLEGNPLAPSQAVRQAMVSPHEKLPAKALPGPAADPLAKRLEGDLDNIVLKALRHDSQQRYGTALQLAEDLERYRLGLPIEARSPSMSYLAGRFLSRHRAAVALGAVVLLLLLASAVGFASLAWKLGQERDHVVAERDRAQLYASLLEDVFQVSTPEQARGEQLTAREILDRAAERVRWLPTGQAHAKADLMATLGDIYRRLGLLDEAEGLLLNALELERTHSPPTAPGIPKAERNLARLEFAKGDYDTAKTRLGNVVQQAETRYGRSHLLVAEALFDLADGLHQAGDYELATSLASEAWEIQRRLGASMEDQLATRMLQANLLATQGRVQESIALQEDVLEGYRRLYGDHHFKVAETSNDLAAAMVSAGQADDAEAYYLRSLEIRREILDPAHPEIVQSLNNLAALETFRNRPIAAEDYARQALELAKQSMPKDHPNLSFMYLGLASARLKLNDPGAAEAPARRSYELRRNAFGPEHPLTVRARLLLAKVTLRLDCLDEAEHHLLAIRGQLDPQSQNWLRDQEVLADVLADLYAAQGQHGMAARYVAEKQRAAEARLAAWN